MPFAIFFGDCTTFVAFALLLLCASCAYFYWLIPTINLQYASVKKLRNNNFLSINSKDISFLVNTFFLQKYWILLLFSYTIRNLILYINFFFHWLSVLMHCWGITDKFNVGKETEKIADTPLVLFGLDWNKYEVYSFKMSFVWWPNNFFIACVSFKVGIW